MDVLVIGGTRFIGRHVVDEFLAIGASVTVFNRGKHANPFAEVDEVSHHAGDRTIEGELRSVARENPDIVIDCVAYHPKDVRVATDIFSDVDAYIYISSGAAYRDNAVPKRADETELESCSTEQAIDESSESYGPRKAEGDRAVRAAAESGIRAMSIRPPIVYGPYDYTERLAYWVNRVQSFDQIIVPGDGMPLRHMVYVEDVAAAIRCIAAEGNAGDVYNVGDDHIPPLAEWIELLADTCDTEIEPIYASRRELEMVDLSPNDFPLYRSYPHILDTSKLRSLGWRSTPHEKALSQTVEEHQNANRDGADLGIDRGAEEHLIDILGTVQV